jgi:P-type Cu+ transporter
MTSPATTTKRCAHCGDSVVGEGVVSGEATFCCNGCSAVYRILHAPEYSPVVNLPAEGEARFAYLDEPQIVKSLLSFSDGEINAVNFVVPQMHCSSCVWLLENLHRLDQGVLLSRVDFLKKRIVIHFADGKTTLRHVVELLTALGYEPCITMGTPARTEEQAADHSLYYRVGVAGFCFGNIMILSFPEYLSGGAVDASLRLLFSWLILGLSLPVFFYCSMLYFRLAAGGLRNRVLTIDVPIAVGILVMFARSVVDVATGAGPGFFDSMSGLVFFLLLGRLFQAKTYDALSFERTYESYFPLAVTVLKGGSEQPVAVANVRPGDRLLIRNSEIIPTDAVVMKGTADIDYSFVTGEARTVRCDLGTLVRAGGRQVGTAIELEVVAEASQSYLTQLWNSVPGNNQHKGRLLSISHVVSKVFTYAVLLIGVCTVLYWVTHDQSRVLDALTAVLIIACPCALALSTPFAFGTAQRIMGNAKLYLKNAAIVEQIANTNTIVFDKTGTLTRSRSASVTFVGAQLSERERAQAATLAYNSAHPLSRSIYASFTPVTLLQIERFAETPGQGIEGVVEGRIMRLGAVEFATTKTDVQNVELATETRVYLSIDGTLRGYFSLAGEYREGIAGTVGRLKNGYALAVLTGDTDWERQSLNARFGSNLPLHFGQTPQAKLEFVESLQKEGKSVLMIGDGLNDAVALRAADVGIALTDDAATFTPASDAILNGGSLTHLDRFLALARMSKNVVVWSYGISFLYNVVGLSYAIRGALSPIVAAILMPLSSITVVAFVTIAVRMAAKKSGVTG